MLASGFQKSADLHDLGEDGLTAMWTTPAEGKKIKELGIEIKNWAEFRDFELVFGMGVRK